MSLHVLRVSDDPSLASFIGPSEGTLIDIDDRFPTVEEVDIACCSILSLQLRIKFVVVATNLLDMTVARMKSLLQIEP